MKKAFNALMVMTCFATFTPLSAMAIDVFVVDAKGVPLEAGQVLDGSKPLNLAVGQKVTLITADGRTIKLKGPANEPPVAGAAGNPGDMVESLQGLIKARAKDMSSAGIIREGTVSFTQPTPWLIEVRHSGDRCLLDGEQTVMWRSDVSQKAGDVEIGPADKSWAAHAVWPMDSDKLALPPTLKLHDGQTYLVSLEQSSPVNVTIHVIPKSVKADAARAAWMIEMGCEPQAKALIAMLR